MTLREVMKSNNPSGIRATVSEGKQSSLTEGVGLAIFVRDSKHTHHSVTLLPQAAVDLLAKLALTDYS